MSQIFQVGSGQRKAGFQPEPLTSRQVGICTAYAEVSYPFGDEMYTPLLEKQTTKLLYMFKYVLK